MQSLYEALLFRSILQKRTGLMQPSGITSLERSSTEWDEPTAGRVPPLGSLTCTGIVPGLVFLDGVEDADGGAPLLDLERFLVTCGAVGWVDFLLSLM